MANTEFRILCCHSLAKGESAFTRELIKAGYKVDSLPLIDVDYHTPDLQEVEQISTELSSTQWLVFSSPHGVEAFCRIPGLYSLLASNTDAMPIKVGLVGEKTKRRFESYFPKTFFVKHSDSFEILLTAILKNANHASQKIYHITSFESLTLMLLIPPPNLELLRRPLYRTFGVAISNDQIDMVINQDYNLIFFSSPSTYVFFTKIPAFNSLLQKTRLAAAGGRTRDFIEQSGNSVSIVSKIPRPVAFVKTLNSEIKKIKYNAERLA